MYQSKFLLNRQKIINAADIAPAIAKYFEYLPQTQRKFIYRMEWYRIGVVVPLMVYSEKQPLMQIFKECQMYKLKELQELPKNGTEVNFSLFAVPSKSKSEYDEDKLKKWFNKKIAGAAEVTHYEFGPNNCLYSQTEDGCSQQQTYTVKGSLKIADRDALDKLRKKAVGYGTELGCGLLFISEA